MEEHLISINQKLSNLTKFVDGVALGVLGGLIIDGEPGVGKTHTVLSHLEKNHPIVKVTRLSGSITPLAAYHTMGDNSEKGNVIIFDDCDSIFMDGGSLNNLKAAVDTRINRIVTWGSSSMKVMYPSFQFSGGIIILTNANFNSPHFKALLDRIHVFELRISQEEKIARIFDVAKNSEICDPYVGLEIAEWLVNNKDKVVDLSLRTFVKTAELAKFSNEWRELASLTLFRNF